MNNDTLWLTKYKNSGEVAIETDAKVLKRLGVVDFEIAEKAFYNFAMGEERPKGIRHLKGRVKP
jgi:hypothetical protein